MKCTPLAIPDVCLIEPDVYGDARGFLVTTWNDERFRQQVADVSFVQDNHSRSRQWTLRGLHFQVAHTQGKLVRCASGRLWDVAVDVRRASPSFGRWVSAELSDENHHQLWIPPGFAHGFVALSEVVDVHYKVTDRYDPASERTIRWDDADLAIEWPLPAGVVPLLSPRDRVAPTFAQVEAMP